MNTADRAELVLLARRLERRALTCLLVRARCNVAWTEGRVEGLRDAARMLREEALDDYDEWRDDDIARRVQRLRDTVSP